MYTAIVFKKRKTAQFLITILLFLVVIFYFVIPEKSEVSLNLYKYYILIYAIATFVFFRSKKRSNYFDFDFIFVSIYTICSFLSTAFYNNELIFWNLFLRLQFNTDYINVGNLLSLIGILSYYIGGLSVGYQKLNKKNANNYIQTGLLGKLLLGFMILFVLLGGGNFYKSVYMDTTASYSPFVTHILLLINVISIVYITLEIYNKENVNNYKIQKLPLLSIFAFVMFLLTCGNRTAASIILLPILGLYTMSSCIIKLRYMFICILVAIVCMSIIGILRLGNNIDGFSSMENLSSVFVDLVLPSRNNYEVFDFVNEYGFTYGTSMFSSIYSIIPFISNLFNPEDSATLLTKYYYNNVNDPNQVGLGTTINADIYMAFGIFGVLIFMFLLGRFVSKAYIKAFSNNLYGLLSVALLMAFSVYWVRTPYFYPARYWVYCFFLTYYMKSKFLSVINQ